MSQKSTLQATTVAVAITFTVYAALVIADLMRAHGESAPYFISDWQINYAAGFVRRGLLGEVARQFLVHFAIDTRTTIVAMQAFSYVVFFAASALLFVPILARHPLFAFAVFSPITIAFKALDSGGALSGHNTTGAKDIVFLALVAVQAALSVRDRTDPSASVGRLFLLSLVWAAAVLVYEGFFFFLPFPLAMIVLTARAQIRPGKLALIAMPALLAFVASTVFRGDASFGAPICASLGSGAPVGCEKVGAIAWLTRPAMYVLRSTYYVIVQPPYILLASVQAAMLGGVGLVLVALDRDIANWISESLKNRVVTIMVIACILGPVPIFAASDHGKYLHLWFCSALFAIAAFISRRSDCALSGVPGAGNAGVLTRALWSTLFVAYVVSWGVKGPCCPEGVNAGFLGRVFPLITQRL